MFAVGFPVPDAGKKRTRQRYLLNYFSHTQVVLATLRYVIF